MHQRKILRQFETLVFATLIMAAGASMLPLVARAQEPDQFADSDLPVEEGPWRVRGDYLIWWTKGNSLPALVTTSPAGTPRVDAGVLGSPGTQVLYGEDAMDDRARSGGRLVLTRWLRPDTSSGIEGSFLYITDDGHSGQFSADSTGLPILARPFFNVFTNLPDSELVAYPAVVSGRVDITSSSEVYSGDAFLRQLIVSTERGRIDVLAGYRYFRLHETLAIGEDLRSTDPGGLFPPGTQFLVADQFETTNQFHGGELGISAEVYRDVWTIELVAKVALGAVNKQTHIDGRSVVNVAGLPPASSPGGLLALPSNMGVVSNSDFAALPEFAINGSLRLTPRVSIQCGYTLMMLNNVARVGEQIDTTINPTQIGGAVIAGVSRPSRLYADSDFWIQGLSLGMAFDW